MDQPPHDANESGPAEKRASMPTSETQQVVTDTNTSRVDCKKQVAAEGVSLVHPLAPHGNDTSTLAADALTGPTTHEGQECGSPDWLWWQAIDPTRRRSSVII